MQAILRLINNKVDSMQISDVLIGTVETDTPLTIRIDQKLLLTEEELLITSWLSDRDYDIDTDEQALDWTHSHTAESGEGTVTIDNAGNQYTHKHIKLKLKNKLKVNDKVYLLACRGGQRYLVIDKVV
jgi:hypothetical protein